MSIKEIATEYTGVYRCPDKIENFKIKIKLKESTEEPNKLYEEKIYEKTFSWQRKTFSKFETEFYTQEINCITDLEKQYHNLIMEISKKNTENCILFSYIEADQFSPHQQSISDKSEDKSNYLEKALQNLDLKEGGDGLNYSNYNILESLQNSIEDPLIHREFENMFLMADLGEYFEDTWVKNEHILCTVKYDKISKILYMYPDLTLNTPYYIQTEGEKTKRYYYYIENASEKLPESVQMNENELVSKINSQKDSIKKQQIGKTFMLPPKNKLIVFVFFEILFARGFEYTDVFVQYFIDLPEQWFCNETSQLKGMTQTCRSAGEDGLVHFNHCFEFAMEYNLQHLKKNEPPKSPCIYFEIFSKDNWDRYRTEGLCYKTIPISNHGLCLQTLPCFRLCSGNPTGNLRRFFIGDCQNYDDVRWIACPRDQTSSVINKFGINTTATGELSIRMNIVHQSQAFLEEFNENAENLRERMIFEKLNSSSLIRSVEQVLQAFKKARKDMIEARKNV